MLASRVATAAVLIAILLPALLFGGVEAIALVVTLFSAVAVWELSGNLPALKPFPNRVLTLCLGVLMVAVFYRFSEKALFAVVVLLPAPGHGPSSLPVQSHREYRRIRSLYDIRAGVRGDIALPCDPPRQARSVQRLGSSLPWLWYACLMRARILPAGTTGNGGSAGM